MTERWVKQATKAATDGWSGDAWAVSISDTVTLLARQHRAFVRMVKKLPRIGQVAIIDRRLTEFMDADGEYIRRDDLLAALATHRKGRR